MNWDEQFKRRSSCLPTADPPLPWNQVCQNVHSQKNQYSHITMTTTKKRTLKSIKLDLALKI